MPDVLRRLGRAGDLLGLGRRSLGGSLGRRSSSSLGRPALAPGGDCGGSLGSTGVQPVGCRWQRRAGLHRRRRLEHGEHLLHDLLHGFSGEFLLDHATCFFCEGASNIREICAALRATTPAITSSSVSGTWRMRARTAFFWPMRWVLAIACATFAGVQSGSTTTTSCAAVSVIAVPQARVWPMKTRTTGLFWNSSMAVPRSLVEVEPLTWTAFCRKCRARSSITSR